MLFYDFMATVNPSETVMVVSTEGKTLFDGKKETDIPFDLYGMTVKSVSSVSGILVIAVD